MSSLTFCAQRSSVESTSVTFRLSAPGSPSAARRFSKAKSCLASSSELINASSASVGKAGVDSVTVGTVGRRERTG